MNTGNVMGDFLWLVARGIARRRVRDGNDIANMWLEQYSGELTPGEYARLVIFEGRASAELEAGRLPGE